MAAPLGVAGVGLFREAEIGRGDVCVATAICSDAQRASVSSSALTAREAEWIGTVASRRE